jgi:Rrf2 family protein
MLQISKQVDYGLQLLGSLAKLEKDQFLSLRQFSKESDISFLFLQRIARSLKSAGIIESMRGMKGGYVLKRNPKSISLKEIVEALEGHSCITRCLHSKTTCPRLKTCTAHKIFMGVNEHVQRVLAETYIV